MKKVILQVGKKTILKQKTDNLGSLFSDNKDPVSAIRENFSRETLVLMEMPPSTKLLKKEQANNKIYEFNVYMREYFAKEGSDTIKKLPLSQNTSF